MKKLLLLSLIFPLLLLSCDLLNNDDDLSGNFWAHNFTASMNYRIDADLLASGVHCNVWVEKGSGVGVTEAQAVAYNYDNKIYPSMIETFGVDKDGMNTMEWADQYGNRDGKLCILLLDIKDDYEENVFTSYVAGYFWANDFFSSTGSNMRDIIYIDTNPGFTDAESINEAYMTLAHEMQHMMNFITSVNKNRMSMDTWIDEGLSSAAEWAFSEVHPLNRYGWYYTQGNGKSDINIGNNFFVWGNRSENPYALLDDYATVYLFFQWLRLQADNGKGIYKEIVNSDYRDYRAVTSAADRYIDPEYSQWGSLLRDWFAANYINNSTGRYGYRNDPVLREKRVHYAPSDIKEIDLFPGEGVYSRIYETISPSQGVNIKYAGLSTTVDEGTDFSNGALLTYNVNTAKNAQSEKGTTAGSPSASVQAEHSGSRSVSAPVLKGPFRIDAGDLFRKRRIEINSLDMDLLRNNRDVR